MVVIIDGEIVPDDDPRAIRRRGGGGGGASASPGQATPRFGTIGGNGGGGGGGGGASGGGSGQPPPQGTPVNPLDKAAELMGIQGRKVAIPAVFGVRAHDVDLINIVCLGALSLFFGWRIAAGGVVLWFIYQHQSQNQPPAGGGR